MGQKVVVRTLNFKTSEEKTYSGTHLFADQLTLSWRMKPHYGYFFRAESFFNVANYIDYLTREGGEGERALTPYGGKSLNSQSHGESFLSFFQNGVSDNGFYVFDEPETALSPQRQLSLLAIIHEKCKSSNAQFIIATHSPLLLAYPKATIYSCDSANLSAMAYTDTSHYQITKQFLDDPGYYLHHLFKD